MGVISMDFKKKIKIFWRGGVDWRGRAGALDKHDFFLLTACYLLAGKGLGFPMS